jgi:integrase
MYSAHTIRRGFATWASSSGWDIKTLMEYVGWSDMKSALRYVEPAQQFGGLIRKLEA